MNIDQGIFQPQRSYSIQVSVLQDQDKYTLKLTMFAMTYIFLTGEREID